MPLTDQQVMEQIQSLLLEPRDLGATWPSGLWTQAEVLARMNERSNRFLKATQLLVGTATLPVLQGVSRLALPQDWLLTASVVWRGSDGVVKEVPRGDAFEADHGMATWTTSTSRWPLLYLDYDQPMLEIQLAPAPAVAGNIDLLYVPMGAPLDGTGELIGVPDEFAAAAIKFGALADLLGKDARARRPEQAGYCEMRYQLGQAVADLLLHSWT
jgi:hypothetical protein